MPGTHHPERHEPEPPADSDSPARSTEGVERPGASQTEGGAAAGAIVGTGVAGPLGGLVGAAAGSLAGGAADAADDEPEAFDREGQPGDPDRGYDLRDPRMGGHVGGSDPERT